MHFTHLLRGVKVVVNWRWAVQGLAVIAVCAVLTAIAVVPVVPLPIVAVTAVRGSRAVASVTAVALVIAVTLATVILARRVVASAPGARSPAARRTRRATVAITARIEAPRRRRRSSGPLDLQDVVTSDPLIMHVVISIIGISTVLVLHKREQPARGRTRRRNVATNEPAIAVV